MLPVAENRLYPKCGMRLGLNVPAGRPELFDFVAVGEGGIDLLTLVEHLPGFDQKISALNRFELPGGQAATACVGVARLGWRSRWIGATGDDMWGGLLRESLRREGVDVSALVRSGAATRSAQIFVEESSGRRAVIESRDRALDVDAAEFASATLCGGRITLVDGTNMPLSLHVARTARRAGLRTMVDVDRCDQQTMHLLAEIDVVIVPDALARELTGAATAGAASASLGKTLTTAAAIVITMGEEGALGWCRGAEIHVPARKVMAKDTTGAGDAFRAGFAARWLASGGADPDLSDLIEYAGLVAALSCREVGAQSALPTESEVSAAAIPGV
jgi:ribokinase